jgi:hypothetical protein
MKPSVILISLVLIILLQSRQAIYCQERMSEEFNGPFPSWLDAKRDFQAKGDGKTDDTRALQAAMDEAAKGSRGTTLFLPPGTYCITSSLALTYAINVSIVGSDPKQTIIRWTGGTKNSMLHLNGVAYSKFNRITFDGADIADIAVDQSWDGKHAYFDTANEYADDIFKNVKFGIRGGAAGHGFAETSIRRSQFLRNQVAGVSLGNFNALDVWINGCYFEDCSIGITNTLGAGNFKVYNCGFRYSKIADMSISNTGEFSIRNNTSFGSSRFFVAGFTRNPAPTTIEGNIIIDPLYTDAITISNQGPVFIERNTIRSATNSNGPVVRMNTDGFCYDNTFTVPDPVASGGRNLIENNKTVDVRSLKILILPSPAAAHAGISRPIIEVPSGADAVAIQSAINRAGKLKGKRPLVHLPFGKYAIRSTIVIPTGSDLQLVGDGFGDHNGTILSWSGTKGQPMIWIGGSSTCALRDFSLKSTDASANILVTHTDEPGSAIGLQEFHQIGGQTGLLADRLEHCHVFLWDGAFSGLQSAIKVIGSGKPSQGLVSIYSGATSDNTVTHDVSNGGVLYVADEWYEGRVKSIFAAVCGHSAFTASGCHIAVLEHSGGIKLTAFTGLTILTANDISGTLANDNNSAGTLVIVGSLTEEEPFLPSSSPKIRMTTAINRTRNHGSTAFYGGSLKLDDKGIDPLSTIKEASGRTPSDIPNTSPQGIFIYRVMSIGGTAGIIIKP